MDKPKVIIYDFDGTICQHIPKKDYEEWTRDKIRQESLSLPPVFGMIEAVKASSMDIDIKKIIILTARMENDRDVTEEWLLKYFQSGEIDDIIMKSEGQKDLDDIDYKKKKLKKLQKFYNIIRFYDNRKDICKMAKKMGITSCRVRYEGDE